MNLSKSKKEKLVEGMYWTGILAFNLSLWGPDFASYIVSGQVLNDAASLAEFLSKNISLLHPKTVIMVGSAVSVLASIVLSAYWEVSVFDSKG